MKRCHSCGAEAPASADHCPSCGFGDLHPIPASNPPAEEAPAPSKNDKRRNK